jgi:long-chain fatty acid transport protein
MNLARTRLAVAIAIALLPALAGATNGYFSHGYGIKSTGMGGVGIALPQDALAAATNPAGMALVGNRVDFGLTWFQPTRSSEIVGSCFNPSCTASANGNYDANGSSNFFIPEFGYNQMINPTLSLGVSVYGNGGMNTDYKTPVPLFGSTNPGVDLNQLFVAPTIGFKLAPEHAIGLSLNLVGQRFKATGLENFTQGPYSASPGSLTNQGYDYSYGAGVRVGYVGRITPQFSLGATYQSKTNMGKFDKYKGLFAEAGGFDIPAGYGAGVAFKPVPQVNIAADVMRIDYSSVRSIANPLLPNLGMAQLGTDNGAGFGWQDITVFKIGADWALRPDLTLRAGYNHGDQPIPESETLFNILAPGVMKDHYTLGATWTLASKSELSFSFMYAPTVEVHGSNSIPAMMGGGNANLEMRQFSLGVGYGWTF